MNRKLPGPTAAGEVDGVTRRQDGWFAGQHMHHGEGGITGTSP